jgi:hypothetical protein
MGCLDFASLTQQAIEAIVVAAHAAEFPDWPGIVEERTPQVQRTLEEEAGPAVEAAPASHHE